MLVVLYGVGDCVIDFVTVVVIVCVGVCVLVLVRVAVLE